MIVYIVVNTMNEVVFVCKEIAELLGHLNTAPHHQVQLWNVAKGRKVGGTLAASPTTLTI